jgi:membrane-bound lytic murein transglycosylase A
MKKILLAVLLLASCARAPLEDPSGAFLPAEDIPELSDSYGVGSLHEALDKNLKALKAGVNIPPVYNFAGRLVTRGDYALALEALRPELENLDRFQNFVRANFDFYEVYGNEEGPGRIFSTGYYDPVVKGSRKRTEQFSRPIYLAPEDLVTVDLGAYAERFPDLFETIKQDKRTTRPLWRGRLDAATRTVVPYFNRSEIDGAESLKGRKLELAWLDPVDAFFLEIQGSGLVEFAPGDQMRVGYAAQNGYPYQAIGKFLTHVIPLEQMSMQRIRQYLSGVSPAERDAVLNQNPSYVFFQKLKGLSLTYSGAEVTAGRTIATDKFLFPKGVLGFLDIELPIFPDVASLDPSGYEPKPRWVFDQDTGGAIRGGGRVDLYMGQGPEAERLAGVMKKSGHLWVVAPKQEFLERIKAQ